MIARRPSSGHAFGSAAMRPEWPPRRPVLLFDGTCHLCQDSVRFVLRHEKDHALLFSPLQSAAGRDLLARHGLPGDRLESLVVIADGRATMRSEAALAIASRLRVPWSWVRVARALPIRWRDALYDWIARRRYRWFGRDEAICLRLDNRMEDRLLDEPPRSITT